MRYLIVLLLMLLVALQFLSFLTFKKVYSLLVKNAEDALDIISDNGLNNDYIQSALNILDSKQLNCDIVPDNSGHRWIAVSTTDGKNTLNLLRLDEENFGAKADWKATEKKLVNLINNEAKDFLKKFEEKNAENKEN